MCLKEDIGHDEDVMLLRLTRADDAKCVQDVAHDAVNLSTTDDDDGRSDEDDDDEDDEGDGSLT